MSRIDWGRYSGDDVETVVGILLCRRFDRVERVKPSQGDGGLDVIRRELDGWTVWQVKKHSEQPNSDQRSKIKKSFNRALAYAEREGVSIKAWNLVTPVNPTPESLKWFRELTESAKIPCAWLGEEFIDGLAAESPDVVDYYFRDGRQRLVEAVAEFASMSKIRAGIGDVVEPADATDALVAAHKLVNRLDPHFVYDFAVSTSPPEFAETPGLVFASTEGVEGRYITVRILEKYYGALDDRPITGSGIFHTPDDDSRQAVRDFFDYGAPLELESATMSADLPGGLDGGTRTGPIQIVARATLDGDPAFIRFRVHSSDELDIATIKLRVEPLTTGADGKNWRAVAVDWPGQAFSVEQRYTDSTDVMKLTFYPGDLSGSHPELVLPGLRFIKELTVGRKIQLGREFGPMTAVSYPIDKDLSWIVSDSLLRLVEAIAILQECTTHQLQVPNLDELTTDEGTQIIKAARLRQGETVLVNTKQIRFTANESVTVADGDHAIYLAYDHCVTVGETDVSIGNVGFHVAGASLTIERDSDGHPTGGAFLPMEGNDLIHGELRRISDEEH